jgi:hypothetical protein
MSLRKTIPDKAMELCKAAFGSRFTYFYGDPIYIPDSNLPALIVDKEQTAMQGGAPTGMERLLHTITIKIAVNKKSQFSRTQVETPTKRLLEEWAEGIEAATSEFSGQSLAGILRRNFSLEQMATNQDMVIDYGVANRSNNQETVFVDEADVTVTIEELLTIAGRS